MERELCLKDMQKRSRGLLCGRIKGHTGRCRSEASVKQQSDACKTEEGLAYGRAWHRNKYATDPEHRKGVRMRGDAWRKTLDGRISILQSEMRRNTKRRGNR